ncbi:MAG: hypothetical protein AB8I08_25440 [Sandaracinaceae bacterium]
MTKTIQYHTVIHQEGRITHVDGVWVGKVPAATPGSIESCPHLHAYLRRMGTDGWELCGTVPIGERSQMIFKR